ncbi:unnamed protein product [Echinostoma caproni]|uniref:V-SNARE coiled-coil homology domain-containing protein n=1 Tax=Echinostoma caproni TaxID=27848 RepID=A0A182ZZM1_9TREM|nr:unnamed protein product [Echinostoma caproni]
MKRCSLMAAPESREDRESSDGFTIVVMVTVLEKRSVTPDCEMNQNIYKGLKIITAKVEQQDRSLRELEEKTP